MKRSSGVTIAPDTEDLLLSLAFARRELAIAKLEMNETHKELLSRVAHPRDGSDH